MRYTCVKTMELVDTHHKLSNENLIKIFDHLLIIKNGEIWKNTIYYKGVEDLQYLKAASFANFLIHVTGFTIYWFNSMKRIIVFKDGEGRDLLVKYGRESMVTFLNSTPREQTAILKVAEKSVRTRPFSSIRAELFPSRKKKKGESKVENIWELKYNNLKKRYNTVTTKLEQQLAACHDELKKVSRGVRSKKLK